MIRQWWPTQLWPFQTKRQGNTRPQMPRWLVVVLLWMVLTTGLWIALTLPQPGQSGVFEVGRPSPRTLHAPRSVAYESAVLLAAEREKAANRPENTVFNRDIRINQIQRDKLNDLLAEISSIRATTQLSQVEKAEAVASLPEMDENFTDIEITETRAREIVTLDSDDWQRVRDETIQTYERSLDRYDLELDERAIQLLQERWLPAWTTELPEPQGNLVRFLTASFLQVNTTIDQEETEQRKQQARDEVPAQEIQVQAGEVIVRDGEIITEAIIEKLTETGALPQQLGWVGIAGRGMLAALLALVLMLHLFFFQQDIVRQPRPLLVIVLTVVGMALLARMSMPLWLEHPYAVPLALLALVLTVVFNAQIALIGAAVLSVIVGVIDSNTLSTAATLMFGSTVAVLSVRNAERSLTFLLAGVAIAAVTVLAQTAFWLANPSSIVQVDQETFTMVLLYSGVNGGLSAILALGLFNLVGRAAGVVTPLQLMELAHPSQALIRKLIHEAPGTYYHSVSVGNLAEAAAEAIGADALLLRVAAYYHDIGKTIRPFFFTDNQTGRENVHNDLDPRTSAEIIVDHVREGVKMAQDARLPQPIIDFISTHHGTHTIQHFYQLALQQEDTVDINDFRYPGPIPWTREQGILMLADSVEATVRSKAQSGKLAPKRTAEHRQLPSGTQTIDDLVNAIITDRVQSGQLDHTPLTLHDIVLIRQAFITSLQGIYHPRVEYAPQLVRAT